jgi:flagellar biosynthesis protein FlhB
MIQHRLIFTSESLIPRFSKVSPWSGLKRLFSVETLINFAKGIAKITVIALAAYFVLWPERERADAMLSTDLASILGISQSLSVSMLGTVLGVMFVIALADYAVAYFRFMNRQRMSLQEIKEEHRQSEGDPMVKGKLRQMRMERAQQRMMSNVPKATVVITNPTHYAVALRYETGMQAPQCVAKGVDEVALRIRELATKNNVAIVENPPLARTLYASVEIEAEIPEQHYKAVAEVIGYVLNLKKKSSWR